MAVYQNTIANLGVKLEITHASPDVANNRTTITYKASVYKTGSHNPRNELSQTPMYLTINGQSLVSTTAGNYNLEGGTTSQLIKTGTLNIPHGADGSKSFTFSWNVNFTSTNFPYQDFGYRSVTTSGTYVLPNIARASTFTIPSTTITTGSAFTVTIARASGSFTHKVSYIVGNSEVAWTTNAATSYAATVPHSLFNSHKSTASVSGVIRVTTMNGTTEVGSNQRAVTINLASSEIPSFSSVTYTNSNKGMFSRTDQFIIGLSRATATVNTPLGSYSSTISSYEFRYRRKTSYSSSTSKTTNSHQFDAFNFPGSGSENEVFIQARVRDSRGRYSAWKETTDIRVHYYAPPAIGTMTVRRTGSANTTLQVTRNYVVTNMYELGGSTNSNTASLTFQHRIKGSSTVTANTGAGSTTMSLTNSNANLSHVFATNTSYEVRAILKDKLNTVYGSWIGVGTEFVPMDIGPKGVGVGKIHDNGGYNLQVGAGGIKSEGHLSISNDISASGSISASTFLYERGISVSQGRHSNSKTFTVGGTANNYYPVIISSQAPFGFSRYSISRAYNWPAPDTWNTATHSRGGLTFDFEWTGDTSWGGNDKSYRVIQWGETYTTMVGGIKLGYSGGLIVWLRGGGAQYRLASERGMYAGIEVRLTGFTDANNINYPVRSSPVASEIHSSYPVRNNGTLYEYGHRVITTNTISNHAAVVTTGNNGNGNWYQVGSGLLICSQNFSFANKYSDFTLTGSWTFPKAFSSAPSVSATGRTSAGFGDKQEIMNGTLNQVGNTSTTGVDFSWHKFSGAAFGTSSRKYLTVFAIGFP